jgi:methyltransferase (TIGR00027 family)
MNMKGLGDVESTALLTLYCHAIETRSKNPILHDPKAVEIAEKLNETLSGSPKKLDRNLANGKLKHQMVVHIACRAKRYDDYVRDFLKRFPEGVVVNIGCGLDSRFSRIDNGKVIFYDLDLPPMIELKKRFYEETDRYRLIPSSVLDYEWMSQISQHKGPYLFMAEGVFMYLEEDRVKELVLKMQEVFPGSELVCEVINSWCLRGLMGKIAKYKMQKELQLGEGASFQFGIPDSDAMEAWGDGITYLDDWSYFDLKEKKLGPLNLLGKVGFLRKTQWTVHYLLG